MQNQASFNTPTQVDQHRRDDSPAFFSRNCAVDACHEVQEGGITFNRAANRRPNRGSVHYELAVAGEDEDDEDGAVKVAKELPAPENVSGVRKILHPSEALDSARHTVELIIRDALDALQRTKQRLMEILPHSLAASASAAEKPSKIVDKEDLKTLGKSGAINPAVLSPSLNSGEASEKNKKPTVEGSPKEPPSIITDPAMGFIHSFERPSSTEWIIQSRF